MEEHRLTDLGRYMEKKLELKRAMMEDCKMRNSFGEANYLDGQVFALEMMWVELMHRGLLTKEE